MAKIRFRKVKLSAANKERLETINAIIEEYQDQNLVLSLRQLYYQLVSRDVIPNKQNEYQKLSILLKEGRMGGIVDWDAIEDRLRQPYTPNEFDDIPDGMDTLLSAYRRKRMTGQENYLEVWVEKDALSGVLKRVTSVYHVPILVNRGYSSASSMYDSYCRFKDAIQEGRKCKILYLGDFDPSGVDMIRDIHDRILEFLFNDEDLLEEADKATTTEDGQEGNEEYDRLYELYLTEPKCSFNDEGEYFDSRRAWIFDRFQVIPIALTRQQIDRYKPPPNPAKRTDPRAKDFIKKHGGTSWEVDALRPEVLNALLKKEIEQRLNMDQYKRMLAKEKKDKQKLEDIKDSIKPDDDEE